jgi:hypothetical protein
MLSTDPGALLTEIKSAIQYRDSRIGELDNIIRRYTGPYYSSGGTSGSSDYAPENTYYEYLSLMIPRLVYDNPRVQVSSRRPGVQQDVAEALRHGLNRWCKDSNLRGVLVELATDMLLGFGVCLVRQEENKGVTLPEDSPVDEATPQWPVIERISQKRFFIDPQAERWRDARFYGHIWRRDKDDLLQEATKSPDDGWHKDIIESLATSNSPGGEDGIFKDKESNYRGEVWCYEVWVPEVELDDSPGPNAGFHGTIYTLGVGQSVSSTGKVNSKAGYVRDPRPFYGPRTGPYVMYGVYKVPDNLYPLSPLVAVEAQIQDLNTHVSAASTSMMKHKRIVGVNDARTAQLVKNVQHDYVAVVPFEDGKALVQEFELGGQTEQQAIWINTCRQRADRVLGMDEALRGSVTGAGTATEHSIASEAANTRMAFVRQMFADATVSLLRIVAYYMYHDDSIVFPLGEDAIKELGLPPEAAVIFQGGGHGDKTGYSFDDLDLNIEPYSMERASEGLAQKRALEMHSILMNSLPTMAAFPDYPWREHFAKIGNAMNAPDMSELVTNAMLGRLASDLMRAQQSEAQPQGKPSEPRLGKDVAGAPLMPSNFPRPTRSVPKIGEMVGQMLQGPLQQGS